MNEPIIENNRDRRLFDWLVREVGQEEIKMACMRLKGSRKAYLTNICKELNITPPSNIAVTPKNEARDNIASLMEFLKTK